MFKFKNFVLFLLILSLFLEAGCESFRRKFIRKKKNAAEEEVIPAPQEYAALSSDIAYDNHYMYWKSWVEELIDRVTEGNNKKMKSCIEQALYQIREMKRYLKEEKQKQLQASYINQLESVSSSIKPGNLTEAESYRIRSKLETLLINADKEFRPSKVKEWLN